MPLAGRLCDGAGRAGPMYRSDPPRRLGGYCVLLLDLRRERGRREIAEARPGERVPADEPVLSGIVRRQMI